MDYVAAFPLPEHLLPKRLHELLLPIGTDPELRVEVTCFTENEGLGICDEAVYMVMAVVPDDGQAVPSLHTEQGQVAFSTPDLGEKGSVSRYLPSITLRRRSGWYSA